MLKLKDACPGPYARFQEQTQLTKMANPKINTALIMFNQQPLLNF